MTPPIPRRELARRLAHVAAVGRQYGKRGRRPLLYPLAEIMRAHAEWVRDQQDPFESKRLGADVGD